MFKNKMRGQVPRPPGDSLAVCAPDENKKSDLSERFLLQTNEVKHRLVKQIILETSPAHELGGDVFAEKPAKRPAGTEKKPGNDKTWPMNRASRCDDSQPDLLSAFCRLSLAISNAAR